MSDQTYPAPRHVYEADFGGLSFHLRFDGDGRTMQFKAAATADFSGAEAVIYAATPIRPGVFMVTWREADETTVTHVQDFENGVVYTNITKPDHSFHNLSGRWTRIG